MLSYGALALNCAPIIRHSNDWDTEDEKEEKFITEEKVIAVQLYLIAGVLQQKENSLFIINSFYIKFEYNIIRKDFNYKK